MSSDDEIVFLEKVVEFAAMPREGEFVKLVNQEMGNYFGIKIIEITHVEKGLPDVMLEALPLSAPELDKYIASYVAEGWRFRSRRPLPGKQKNVPGSS